MPPRYFLKRPFDLFYIIKQRFALKVYIEMYLLEFTPKSDDVNI